MIYRIKKFPISFRNSTKICKYTKPNHGGATWHMYTPQTEMGDVACQLPMAFSRRNKKLRVTATSLFDGETPGLVCGDCIRVQNIDNNKTTVVMIVDFGGARGLDLSPEAFDEIDDGRGNKRGYVLRASSI